MTPQGRKILLVEDHSDTAVPMARLLSSIGYEVAIAGTCEAAVATAAARSFDGKN